MIAAGAYLDEDLLLASLWTGDLGVALFASDCLDGR